MSTYNKIIIGLVLPISLSATHNTFSSKHHKEKQVHFQKLSKENIRLFKNMTALFSEKDWKHLGFCLSSGETTEWNDPEVLEQWATHFIRWHDKRENNKISLAVTHDKKKAIGFIAYSMNDNTEGFKGCGSWIWWMAISPAYRKQGYGKALLTNIKSGLSEYNNLGVAVSKENRFAQSFYRSNGFVHEGEWDHTMDWMKSTLIH